MAVTGPGCWEQKQCISLITLRIINYSGQGLGLQKSAHNSFRNHTENVYGAIWREERLTLT